MRSVFHGLLKIAILAGSALPLASATGYAGDCPSGKTGVDLTKPGATEPAGLTDVVIASIDLSGMGPALKDYKMRVRKLTVEPGGVVPWHSHGTRPANIYIISGSITEYRSTCGVPIEHPAGDVTEEFGAALSHWWKNNTSQTTVLISADLLAPGMNPKESM
jgi:quercetin dioxygenase-like cupin family protein